MGARPVVARNRRAKRDFDIHETYEAGLSLTGSEVKSIRAGRVSLDEAYARVEDGEIWLHGMHVAPYSPSSYHGHEPGRPRKLLLRQREIDHLVGLTARAGFTLVPLSLHFNPRGYAKLELAVAKGR
ncbi:MAG: SsrA-binding protein SmpB, partial [Candidatus Bipolaricaulota bacterium]